MQRSYFAVFFVGQVYYLPHFLPIGNYFTREGKSVLYVFADETNESLIQKIARDEHLDFLYGSDHIYDVDMEFVFFANMFDGAKELDAIRVFLWHGVGTKPYNFEHALETNDLLLTEGDYKYNRLITEFPAYRSKVKKVGYSKLDAVFNQEPAELLDLKNRLGIDNGKQTILYAPTFYPSSIEKMADDFPAHFADCNVLVKPHFFTYEIEKYQKQREKLAIWQTFKNCIVVPVDEYSLVPFLAVSDLMISDESAAVFEFAALNKPVVLNKFLKLRWSYLLNPGKLRKRLDQDMDRYRKIGSNAGNYSEMVTMVNENLQNPALHEMDRFDMTEDICGVVDGHVSKRILDVLNECS